MTTQAISHKSAPGDDKEAIRKLSDDWLSAIRAKDVPRLASMVTEDAVFLPPEMPPIRGRKAVEALYNSFFPQFSSVEQTASIEEIEVSGDWAFAWGTETLVLTPLGEDASPIRMEGRGMSILRRQPDGSWKYARGISNTVPVPASQPN